MSKEAIVLLPLIPIAVVLWNLPDLKRKKIYAWLKWFPIASVFIGLIVISKLIPDESPFKVRQQMFLHLLSVFVTGGLIVLAIGMGISYADLYGPTGHRKFWLDLTNRLRGK